MDEVAVAKDAGGERVRTDDALFAEGEDRGVALVRVVRTVERSDGWLSVLVPSVCVGVWG